MTRILIAILATVALTLATAWSLGVEPHNARADGPVSEPQAELVRTFMDHCKQLDRKLKVSTQGGIFHMECALDVGVGPEVKRRAR